jgi:hypothetical protein
MPRALRGPGGAAPAANATGLTVHRGSQWVTTQPRIGSKPMRSAMLDLREIGGMPVCLIRPVIWPRALRLLGGALILSGRWCRKQCTITWHYWRLGTRRVEPQRRKELQRPHRG